MVKGTKRAIPIEKILEKNSRAVCFTKRRDGLYNKAADLCLLSDSQIAILATPSSSHSNANASFFSFGHSSVDAVVAGFLAGKRTVPVPFDQEDVGICLRRKDLGLGFWWDDERLAKSEDPKELRAAMGSVSRLLQNLKELRSGEVVDNQIDHRHQTNFFDDEYVDGDREIPPISDNFCSNQELDLDQLIDFDTLWFDDEFQDFSSYDFILV